MKRLHVCVVFLFLTVTGVLLGCDSGSSGDTNSTLNRNPMGQLGMWQGTWQSNTLGDQVTATFSLTRRGNEMIGEIVLAGSTCFEFGNFAGTLTGRQLQGHFDFGTTDGKAGVNGWVDDDITLYSGHYHVESGVCDGDQGAFLFSVPGGNSVGGSGGDSGNDGGGESEDDGGIVGDDRMCCRTCMLGKACGDTCINAQFTCHTPPGCACDK